MKSTVRLKLLSILLVFAYLLSACTGMPGQGTPSGGGKPQAREVAFTGTVDAVDAAQITVSGQTVTLDAKSVLDPNIKVGDIVKVEAQVSETGTVTALKVESFNADDAIVSTSIPDDGSATPEANATPQVASTPDPAVTQTVNGAEKEISGAVESITAESITINGITYPFNVATEFKDVVFAGDTVKLHVIVNADGSFTVREIEKTAGTVIGDDNSGGKGSDDSNDDNGSDDSNDDNGSDDSSGDNSGKGGG